MLDSSKRQLRDYGIFLGLLIFMFAVLFALTIFSRRNWEDGLKAQVSAVLEREMPSEYDVGRFEMIDSPLATSAACYHVLAKSDGKAKFAAIIRIATIYGPEPGVFLIDENGASFVGFALLDSEASERIEQAAEKSQLLYWKTELSRIFASDGKKGDLNETE